METELRSRLEAIRGSLNRAKRCVGPKRFAALAEARRLAAQAEDENLLPEDPDLAEEVRWLYRWVKFAYRSGGPLRLRFLRLARRQSRVILERGAGC